MRAKQTRLSYQGNYRLKEADVDQEGMGAPVSFDSHEWPRMQQEKTQEQEYQELTSGKALA